MSVSELSKAIKQNDVEAVKKLLENGADFNSFRTEIYDDDYEYRIYAITDAIKGGNAEIIGFMLPRDPNMLLIHKDENCTVKVDFYAAPTILEFKYNNVEPTYININKKFIYGSQTDSKRFIKWFTDVEAEYHRILWEWESGNDDFELISRDVMI